MLRSHPASGGFAEKETAVFVKEVWRYPVKSMAGEQLLTARLTETGIEGDRTIQVQDKDGRIVTSRTRPGLLGFRATLDRNGEPLVDGRPWSDPTVLAAVQKIVGPDARLVRDDSLDRFDVLPLLVATDGAIEAFGRDGRRLRPNLIIGGVAGLEERNWPGGRLQIGDVVIRIHDLRSRCVMTTFDPDTLAHDPNVLRDIVGRFGGKLALNCSVVAGGEIQVNQEVRLLRAAPGAHAGN
jgi:uncharacterized protein YcbX